MGTEINFSSDQNSSNLNTILSTDSSSDHALVVSSPVITNIDSIPVCSSFQGHDPTNDQEINILQQQFDCMQDKSKQRTVGSRKEKRRTECINNAFSELRRRIPNVPMDTKLSKIKTLRLATSYISYLTDIIKSSDPCDSRDSRDFRADLKALRSRERRRNIYQVRSPF